METLVTPTRIQPFCSSSPLPKTIPHQSFAVPWTRLSFKLREKPDQGLYLSRRLNLGVAARCGHCGSADSLAELGRDLEAEMNPEGKDDWIVEMGKLREKCKERKGMVELLDCLEREAIMGDDEGREPTDYNRRAQIFDKSSQVFTALKERGTPSHHQS
ncbi:unnamed protein product [Dovyalis caffra]|uniref:Uncharacterized protein n=1 Tax=Dovyalis caffra TaxID=77055 RepID=A0AAV1RXD8_9ROSI|nr:unnamed protein product [Dovyalis caffra]